MNAAFPGEGDEEDEINEVTYSIDGDKLSITYLDDGVSETDIYTRQ